MTAAPASVPTMLRLPDGWRLCPSCRRVVRGFAPGPGGRAHARCPGCQSLERHRFLALLLRSLAGAPGVDTVVDIAPSRQVSRVLAEIAPPRLVRMDFDPSADGRSVDVQASITGLPFTSGSVDLVLCYHVLEHVPDDRRGMAELARVLSPSGLALVQVPFRPNADTDEDPAAPTEERIRRFGQADHVRWYGRDFEDRLVQAGLAFQRIGPAGVLGESLAALFGVSDREPVWLVRRADATGTPPDTARVAAVASAELLAGLVGLAGAQSTQLAELAARTAVLERRLERVAAAAPGAAAGPRSAASRRHADRPVWRRLAAAGVRRLPDPAEAALRRAVAERRARRRAAGGAAR